MSLNIYLLGQRIQNMRKKRGYSQVALSEIIDKSPTFISYLESGSKCMSLDTFVDLANALNATADDLLCDSLENTVAVNANSFSSIISDCSSSEQKVLLEVVAATKEAIRSQKKGHHRI